jgi:hypothetical protein
MNVIPGTTVPFVAWRRTGQRPPLRNEAEAAQRRGLLAKVHIAKKDMGLNSGEYEAILAGFRCGSAGELSVPQLERLVKCLEKLGWKQVRRLRRKDGADELRLDALRRRCVEIAQTIDHGEKRLAGLAVRICGVASLTWCRDAAKLERLLAVLGKIKEES